MGHSLGHRAACACHGRAAAWLTTAIAEFFLAACGFQSAADGPSCQNGKVEPEEECDGPDLRANDCTTIGRGGFVGGTLSCNAETCAFDTSQCTQGPDARTRAHDFNGDGYADVVVVSLRWNDERSAVYVYFGGPGTPGPEPEFAVTRMDPGGDVSVGDLDGDGLADLVVLTFEAATSASWMPSTTRIYAGGPDFASDDGVDATLEGVSGLDPGSTVDFNGDGYTDLVTKPFTAFPSVLYLGGPMTAVGPGPDATLMMELSGGGGVAHAAAAAGDLNGDGYGDLVLGDPSYCPSADCAGQAFVFFGGPSVSVDRTPDAVLAGETFFDEFGGAASAAGDFDGDGYDDVAIGAPFTGLGDGRVYLFRGGPGEFDPSPDALFDGAPGQGLGGTLAHGDFNADGFDDLVIGNRLGSTANLAGAWVFLGGPTIDTVADAELMDPTFPAEDFGASVASPGDVNGDGYDDVVVGAPGTIDYPGHAALYFGSEGSPFGGPPDAIFEGLPDERLFGAIVARR